MGLYENLQQAAQTQANQIQTPYPFLKSYFAPQFMGRQAESQSGAMGNQASWDMAAQREAADAAKQRAVLLAQQRLKELEAKGLGDYQRKAKDIGFDYFDPNGNPISAQEFAKAKGISIVDALKDSNNPGDIAFIDDYNALQSYIAAKQKKLDTLSDEQKQAIEYFETYNPEVKSNASDFMKKFLNNYRHIFGI